MSTEQSVTTPADIVWFKSSYSGTEGGNCIEVAFGTSAVHVRDSKERQGPSLAFGSGVWAAFVAFAAAHDTR